MGTPLHFAAWKGHQEIVELLIAKGAGVNAKDEDDLTPLHNASITDQKEVAALLIANGADVNTTDMHGRTPLDVANERPLGDLRDGNTETADLLRKHGGKTGAELKAEGK